MVYFAVETHRLYGGHFRVGPQEAVELRKKFLLCVGFCHSSYFIMVSHNKLVFQRFCLVSSAPAFIADFHRSGVVSFLSFCSDLAFGAVCAGVLCKLIWQCDL